MRGLMNVGKLKEMIKDLPDDTPILMSGSDHSYYRGDVRVGPATINGGDYSEYWGDEYLNEGDKKVDVALLVE